MPAKKLGIQEVLKAIVKVQKEVDYDPPQMVYLFQILLQKQYFLAMVMSINETILNAIRIRLNVDCFGILEPLTSAV